MFFIAGGVTMGLLHLNFVLFWRSFYSRFPFEGYRDAMGQGLIPPFLGTSAASLLVTLGALFALPLVAMWFARQPWFSALAMWAGVMFSVILIWVNTDQLRNDSSLWPLDFVFLSALASLRLVRPLRACSFGAPRQSRKILAHNGYIISLTALKACMA